ncbi:MAG: LCP family protein [Clostridiales bacterium]|nr:LCP family protein [Clostridiales bacterium]
MGDSKNTSKRVNNQGSAIPGGVITGLLFAVMVVFAVVLVRSALLPVKFLVPVMVLLLALVVLLGSLTHWTGRTGRFAAGTVVSILLAVIMIYAVIALNTLTSALNNITTVSTEVTHVGVYVLTEDEAETLNDLEEDTFGILSELDRTSTDGAIQQLNEDLNTEIATAEYDGLVQLVDGLYDQECRAILLNDAYLDVIAEIEGYEDIEDRIREVTGLEVEEVVEETVTPEQENAESAVTAETDNAFTLYISGIDSRNGLKAKSRSDVNILATVNTETHQILLVSTPRDYYVPLSISNGARDKLTHAGIYGVSVSMDTLAMLYDVDVDYYFRVSFEGFEDIVDALGGVSVYSEYTFSSSFISGLTFAEGYNYVNGEQALAFARERYAFATGDRQRGKNQMALIQAIIKKAISPSILVNYSSILSAVEDNFETSLSYDLIASLVSDQLSTGADWEVITYSVDGSNGSAVPYSMSTTAYVMIPDESTVATAKELMQAVLNGEIISQP